MLTILGSTNAVMYLLQQINAVYLQNTISDPFYVQVDQNACLLNMSVQWRKFEPNYPLH